MSEPPRKRCKLTTNKPAPQAYKFVLGTNVTVPPSMLGFSSVTETGRWYTKDVRTGKWTPYEFPRRSSVASRLAVNALEHVMASHYFHENKVLEECLFRNNRLLRAASRSREALRAQVNSLRSQLNVEIQSRVFWETMAVDMATVSAEGADMMRTRLDALQSIQANEILDVSTEEE